MYKLDTNAARKADAGGTSIKTMGKYVGEFTQVRVIKSKSGGPGVEFEFKSTAGQKARLSLYTMSASGEKYQGYDTLMAIMTCMSLRNLDSKPGTITKYDFNIKQDIQEEGEVFAELCKPIGVLLETEDYESNSGTKTRVVLKSVFNAKTELTASEILDRKTTPELLPKMVEALRHKPVKDSSLTYSPNTYQPTSSAEPPDYLDSDIPF